VAKSALKEKYVPEAGMDGIKEVTHTRHSSRGSVAMGHLLQPTI